MSFYGTDHPEPVDPGPADNPAIDGLTHEQSVVRSRMMDGDAFILDAPDHVPPVWGRGDQVLWAEGESLIVAGSPGVGKTTIAGQLVRARLIGGDVLGLPVAPGRRRLLYLAMDRPLQIRRALHRVLGDLPAEVLKDRLRAWPGPPIADIAKHPATLKGYADLADADTIVVDSLKDAAIGLTEDDVAAGYNRARQECIAAGIELIELHHLVKRGANGAKPTTLSDLYGSVWITAGAGSVILLHGVAGDPIVELAHLKHPAAEVGPWRVMHDHDAGVSNVWHSTDLVMMAKARGASGLTAKAAAVALFSTDKPTPAQVEKARRRLTTLERSGQLTLTPGDEARQTAAVWTLTNSLTDLLADVTPHDADEPSRGDASEHEQTLTPTLTTLTRPDPHVSPPLFKGGERGSEETGDDDRPKPCDECGHVFHSVRRSRRAS